MVFSQVAPIDTALNSMQKESREHADSKPQKEIVRA